LEISAFSTAKVEKKGCCFAGQMALSATDGCRAGRPEGDSSNRIVRRVQTAVQKHQPECALRDKSPGAEHNIQELWLL